MPTKYLRLVPAVDPHSWIVEHCFECGLLGIVLQRGLLSEEHWKNPVRAAPFTVPARFPRRGWAQHQPGRATWNTMETTEHFNKQSWKDTLAWKMSLDADKPEGIYIFSSTGFADDHMHALAFEGKYKKTTQSIVWLRLHSLWRTNKHSLPTGLLVVSFYSS